MMILKLIENDFETLFYLRHLMPQEMEWVAFPYLRQKYG